MNCIRLCCIAVLLSVTAASYAGQAGGVKSGGASAAPVALGTGTAGISRALADRAGGNPERLTGAARLPVAGTALER